MALLQTRQPSLDSVLATLINELSAAPTELDLVLDDYHLVDNPDLQPSVAYLLEHLPPQVHLVISTRVDPALPLARLRARGELVEIRAADLRFTLSRGRGLPQRRRRARAHRQPTSPRWRRAPKAGSPPCSWRRSHCGDAPTRARSSLPSPATTATSWTTWPRRCSAASRTQVRDFLLQTSILDRLSGPLCAAVTGNTESQEMLEHLDRANLFLVPLDDTRRWYRYHHLFAEVLQTHLLDGRAEEVADLHRRASRWYDEAGEPVPAVRHALAAGDIERAADLAELAVPALQRDRQEATIAAWLALIPDDVVQARPVLALGFIAALMSNGQFTGVEERLHDLEQHLPDPRPDGQASEPPPGPSSSTGASGTGYPLRSSCTAPRCR